MCYFWGGTCLADPKYFQCGDIGASLNSVYTAGETLDTLTILGLLPGNVAMASGYPTKWADANGTHYKIDANISYELVNDSVDHWTLNGASCK